MGEASGRSGDDDGGSSHSAAGLGVRFFEEVAKGREAKVAANWSVMRGSD